MVVVLPLIWRFGTFMVVRKFFDMLKAYKSFDVNQIFSIFVP